MTTEVAPGFVDLEHLFERRVIDAVGWDTINDAVTESARLHTEAFNKLAAAFVRPLKDNNKPRIRFNLPVSAAMQPLRGEDDSPVPTRGVDSYNIGFPLSDAGFAWADNRKSRVKMTVGEANEMTVTALRADRNWNRAYILAAIFDNTSHTFKDKEFGDIPCKPLANGDTDQYNLDTGETATDTHYLAQADAIDGTHNPFPVIEPELTEHPSNSGDVIVYCSTSLKAPIRALGDFIPYYQDSRIKPSLSTDMLEQFPIQLLGDTPLGWVDGCFVVEWKAIPAGYTVSHTTEGGAFVGRREEPEPELQGLRSEIHEVDGNHIVNRLLRTAGYAIMNRVAAVVYYVGGASYVVPSGYSLESPLFNFDQRGIDG